MAQKSLGEILQEMELVTAQQVKEALNLQKKQGGAIGKILIDLGYVTEEEVCLALAAQTGMEVADLDNIVVPEKVLNLIPPSVAKSYKIIPISLENNVLTIAINDPFNVSAIDDIRLLVNKDIPKGVGEITVNCMLATTESIEKAFNKLYGKKENIVDTMLKEMSVNMQNLEAEYAALSKETFDLTDPAAAAQAAPVVKLLNLLLLQAIRDRASDVHFEPFENEFRVRYRIDGVMHEVMPPPYSLAVALVARIKVMTGTMDITETRVPQDGRITTQVGNRTVDLRVSTLPTVYGESVVMRVLDRSVVSLNIENLGLREDEMNIILKLLGLDNGIIIVTGPTGSGKTTTLYACLNKINTKDVKIITTEDPVEYDIDGLVQCQVNEEIGLTYAAALRVILRQDPDYILVGEIRDLETAEIAVEAALTGHLVFTTLHTNDAPSTVVRLIDLGVEPYLVTATLNACIAQRLVRKICVNCKEEYEPSQEVLYELNLRKSDVEGKKFYYGKGCKECNNTGYKGRMAIFEMMILSPRIKELILARASTEEIRRAAREEGMRTLRESGLYAIYDGYTTVDEIVKETLFT